MYGINGSIVYVNAVPFVTALRLLITDLFGDVGCITELLRNFLFRFRDLCLKRVGLKTLKSEAFSKRYAFIYRLKTETALF